MHKTKNHKEAAEIKQTINQEASNIMWFLIKRTVQDPCSPSVMRVQKVVNGEVQEYTVQEDVEMQYNKNVRSDFLLHTAPC
jgi:hypothetical protein